MAYFGCLVVAMAENPPLDPPALLTVKQAADQLSLSIWTIYTPLEHGPLGGAYP